MIKSIILFSLIFNLSTVYGQKLGKVDIAEVLEEKHPTEPDTKAAIVKQIGSKYFEYNRNKQRFELITEVYKKIKIYKDSGKDLANIKLKYYQESDLRETINGVKAIAYNQENGKLVKSELSSKDIYTEKTTENWMSENFAIPNVKKGTVIEYKYKLRSPFVYEIPKWQIQYNIPCDESELTVSIPEYFQYNTRTTGSVELATKKEQTSKSITFTSTVNIGSDLNVRKKIVSDNVRYTVHSTTYKASNVPSLRDEEFVFHMNSYRSGIVFELLLTKFPNSTTKYYTKSWNSIAKQLHDSQKFGKELNKKIKDSDSFISSIKDLSPEEKIAKVYYTIKEKVEWNKNYGIYPSKALKETYKTKVGSVADLNLLLIHTLRKAGLTAFPVATKHIYSGLLNQHYPTLTDLNYILAVVQHNDKVIFLDATDANVDIGYLPTRATNLHGILLINETADVIEITNPNKDQKVHMLDLKLSEDLICHLDEKAKYSHNASKELQAYQSYSSDELIDAFENNNEGIYFEALEIENTSKKYPTYNLNASYESENLLETIGNKLFLDCTANKGINKNPFIEEKRNFPVFFKEKQQETIVFTINVPEGYQILELPDKINVAMENGMGTFAYSTNTLESKITVTSILKLNTTFVDVTKYEALKSFFNIIVEKHNEKIVLQKI